MKSIKKPLFSKNIMDFVIKQQAKMQKYDSILLQHNIGVGELSLEIGRRCNLFNQNDLKLLYFSGLLHDIGKIFLSQKILNKPSRLNVKEMNYVQQHSDFGANYIEKELNYNTLFNSIDIKKIVFNIRHHHELLDGSGYPDELKVGEIPISTQILTISDNYVALKENRSYKDPWSDEEIIKYLNKYSSYWFNGKIINSLKEIIYTDSKEKVIDF